MAICFLFFSIIGGKFLIERYYLYPIKYENEVISNARLFGVDSALVFATVNVESRFNKDAVSNRGAKGLMQLTDSTASSIAIKLGVKEYDIFDVNTNLKFGCYYLKYLISKFNNVKTAITAYNAGEGNVSFWLTKKEYSKDGKNLDYIAFPETREYINKIEKSLIKYKKLYGKVLDK